MQKYPDEQRPSLDDLEDRSSYRPANQTGQRYSFSMTNSVDDLEGLFRRADAAIAASRALIDESHEWQTHIQRELDAMFPLTSLLPSGSAHPEREASQPSQALIVAENPCSGRLLRNGRR